MLLVTLSGADAAPFVQFMLECIRDSLATTTPQVRALLRAISGEMTRQELQAQLELADRENFRKQYLGPALKLGLIEMLNPDKPTSRSQRYRLTESGSLARWMLVTAIRQ